MARGVEMEAHVRVGGTPDEGVSVSAAVLAGGTSRRMGRDKRFLDVAGRPLLTRAVTAAGAVCPRVTLIVGDDGPLPDLPAGVRTLRDAVPGAGPLGGLVTALGAADTDLVLLVAGDHPHLVPDVLRRLVDLAAASGVDGVVLTDRAGRPQPLVGVYRTRAHATLRAAFGAGERRAAAVLDLLDVQHLPLAEWYRYDPAGLTLRDLDAPGDLADYLAAIERHTAAETGVVRLHLDGDGVTGTADRDRLGREEPLRVRAGGPGEEPVDVFTTLRSPGTEAELAVGWLFTEGLYAPAEGPATVRFGDPRELSRPEDTVTVSLPHPLPLDAAAHRHTMATASCGVCGRASIDELAARCLPLPVEPGGAALAARSLLQLPRRLGEAQAVYAATGGVHATGLFDARLRLTCLREDVGRHNALDAAIGAQLLAGRPDADAAVAVLSGRIGFELVSKAAVARIPIVVAVGAPTDLAVHTAERLGITLVGFVRGARGNVYTHPSRVGTD